MTPSTDEGHLDHIAKAYALGTHLIIITHQDKVVQEKKGYCFQTLEVRKAILEGVLARLGGKGSVFVAKEDDVPGRHYKDGIGDTLRILKPDILAKGGDRTASNMPSDEIAACKECDIEIRYGIGDLLNSSSRMVEDHR